jgi:hypothetical protein
MFSAEWASCTLDEAFAVTPYKKPSFSLALIMGMEQMRAKVDFTSRGKIFFI